MKRIFVLEPVKSLRDGLFLVHDDDSIRKVLQHIKENSWVGEVEFFADHDVDVSQFGSQPLQISNRAFLGGIGGESGDIDEE